MCTLNIIYFIILSYGGDRNEIRMRNNNVIIAMRTKSRLFGFGRGSIIYIIISYASSKSPIYICTRIL